MAAVKAQKAQTVEIGQSFGTVHIFLQMVTSTRELLLSGEGVVSSHFVVATGLVSRHRSEFGTLRAVRFCGLEAVAQAILGALESLQRRSKTRLQAAAQQLRNRLPAACQLP